MYKIFYLYVEIFFSNLEKIFLYKKKEKYSIYRYVTVIFYIWNFFHINHSSVYQNNTALFNWSACSEMEPDPDSYTFSDPQICFKNWLRMIFKKLRR